jgi:hypothetical protein
MSDLGRGIEAAYLTAVGGVLLLGVTVGVAGAGIVALIIWLL